MQLWTKITLLFLLLFAFMATCVYTHLDDFTSSTAQSSSQKEETIVLNSSDKPSQEDSIQQTAKSIEATKEVTKQNKESLKPDNVSNQAIQTQAEESSPTKTQSISKKEVQAQINAILEDKGIIFKRMSYNVSTQSLETIKEIAQVIEKYDTFKYEVAGHTDAKGDEAFNQMVSQQRAQSVMQVLNDLGISLDRLTAKGYGEAYPIVPNDPKGYSLVNRRVEINIIED